MSSILFLLPAPQLLVSLLPSIRDAILKECVLGVGTLGSNGGKTEKEMAQDNI